MVIYRRTVSTGGLKRLWGGRRGGGVDEVEDAFTMRDKKHFVKVICNLARKTYYFVDVTGNHIQPTHADHHQLDR